MSWYDYQASKGFGADPPFYALIMAAMRRADTTNAAKLRQELEAAEARVHSLERALRRIADFPRPWGGALSAADEMRALARAVVLEGAAGNEQADAGGVASDPRSTEAEPWEPDECRCPSGGHTCGKPNPEEADWVDGPLGHLESDA